MNVSVTVHSRQYMDGESANTDFTALGKWVCTDRGDKITYCENDATTTVFITDVRVRIHRKGEMDTLLILEENQCHTGTCQTPYGTFSLAVTAKTITNQLSEIPRRLFVAYQMEMGGGTTQNEIEIVIKEVS